MEREGEIKTESSYLLVHSLNACSYRGRAEADPEAANGEHQAAGT